MSNSREHEELIKRSGIRGALAAEDAANSAAIHAAAVKRKADAKAVLSKDMPDALQMREAARKKAADALKLANQAFVDANTAEDLVSTIVGTEYAVRQDAEREMLKHCDPRIDALKAQLHEMHISSESLYRTWPDAAGRFKDMSGTRVSDNRDAIQTRIRACVDGKDACDRLKVDETATDIPAALAAILASVPKA
jgi:hypothetical protein